MCRVRADERETLAGHASEFRVAFGAGQSVGEQRVRDRVALDGNDMAPGGVEHHRVATEARRGIDDLEWRTTKADRSHQCFLSQRHRAAMAEGTAGELREDRADTNPWLPGFQPFQGDGQQHLDVLRDGVDARHAELRGQRDRKSTRLNSSHVALSRMPSSA